MSPNPNPGEPPAGDPAQPPAGTDAEPQAGDAISLDEAKKLRSEAKSLRARLAAAEQKVSGFEAASLSESEKLQKQIAELNGERDTLKTAMRQAKAQAAVAAAGAEYPDLVASKIPDDVLDGDDPKAVTKAIDELRKQYPNLFKSPTGRIDGGDRGGVGPPPQTFGADTLRAAYAESEPRRR